MVKIRLIIIKNVNIFTIYETLFQIIINISPIIHQNKSKMTTIRNQTERINYLGRTSLLKICISNQEDSITHKPMLPNIKEIIDK